MLIDPSPQKLNGMGRDLKDREHSLALGDPSIHVLHSHPKCFSARSVHPRDLNEISSS